MTRPHPRRQTEANDHHTRQGIGSVARGAFTDDRCLESTKERHVFRTARMLVAAFAICGLLPEARAADVTAQQIQASFTNTWSKALYIQAAKDYYAAKHPNWSAYVTSLSAGGNRFAGAEVKPCAALYRETGDTKYSDAIRAFLVGTINNNKIDYAQEMDFNYSYIQIRDSPSISAADRTLIEDFISQRMDWLMTQDEDTTFVRGMINCTALAYAERVILPADPHAATWRAWHQAKWNLGMARIGDAVENSSNYAPMWFQGLYEYLRVTGADIEDYFNQPSVRNFCERTLQLVSSLGYVPTYGGTTDFRKLGGRPGMYETMATVYRDGRYKTAAQRILNFQRVVVDPFWFGPVDDICAIPVFENADDTVAPVPLLRPTASTYTRTFIDKTYDEKLVMESGSNAGDSSVLMDFAQGLNHGKAGGSALVSFVDKASPLLVNSSNGDRVYQNLMMVRSTAEAFPFVPASAGQPGQQYVFDNVRRRYVFNIKGPEATNGGVPDPASLSKLTIYLAGSTSIDGDQTVRFYIDNVKAAGPGGTLALSGGGSFLNPGNWTDVSFGGTRDLSTYDTLEFGMRIEVLTPGAITDVITLLQTPTSGGYHFKQDLDTCSLGKANQTESFAKLQFASTEMQLKDTLGGDNIQQRDIMLVPGGILFVRDRVTFPSAEANVQMGPVWNAAELLSSGANWFDLRQAKAYALPQRQLLTLFPPRTDSSIPFTNGISQDPKSSSMIAWQKWTGNAAANSTRTFNSLLMGHDAGTSAADLAATVQTLQCDETATVLKIGGNFLVINPDGEALNIGGLQTNAKSLYLETSGNTATYFAGTQGSSVVFSGTSLFSSGTLAARFGSAQPVLTVPSDITAHARDSGGAIVHFSTEALDNTDGPLVPVSTPPSGSVFPPGNTTVHCSVTNSLGQTTSASFTVTVLVSEIWTNPAAGTWSTGTNWSLGRVPVSTDPVVLTTSGQPFSTVPQITVGATSAGTLTIDSPTVSNVLNYAGSTPQVMSLYGLTTDPLISITGNASPAVSVNKVDFRMRVGGMLQIDSGKTFTLGNSYISENSAGLKLTKTGAGTLAFTGSSNTKISFTGGLEMKEGTWIASQNSSSLPTSGLVNFTNTVGTNAKITLNTGCSIEALAGGNANSTIDGTSSLSITGSQDTTYGGTIGGALALTLNGAGSLALTGGNTYSGATNINSGNTLKLGSGGTTGKLSTSSAINNDGTLIFNRSNTVTQGTDFKSTITGTGAIIHEGSGTLALTSGSLSSGTLHLQSTLTGPAVTLGLSGGVTVANAIVMDSTTGREMIASTGTGNNSLTGGMTVTGAAGNALVIANNQTSGNLTFSGGISGSAYLGSVSLRGSQAGAAGFLNGAVNIASDLQNNGTTNWTVNAIGSTYTGTRFIGSGGIILAANNAIATGAQVYWTNTATGQLDMNGFDATVAGLNTSLTTPNTTHGVTNNGTRDSVLTLSNMLADLAFSGTLGDGSTHKLSLVMSSADRVQSLDGPNTYTGATAVITGALKLGAAGSITSSSTVSIAPGAVLDTTAQSSFTMAASQPVTFGLEGSGSGSCGRIAADGLDISTAVVTFDITGPLDDPAYVLASYTVENLIGSQFASITPPGGYHLDYAHNGGTQIALVQNNSSGYTAWIADFPVADDSPAGDPDHDGIASLLEYVLDGNPGSADTSILPAASIIGSAFKISFKRLGSSLADTRLTLQYGGDMTHWTDVEITAASALTGVATVTITDGSPADSVTVSIPMTEARDGKLFARLKVTQ